MRGCPRHPEANRACKDVRCLRTWKPDGAPTVQEQLDRWVAGESVCPNEDHDCCPDFSCCRPKLAWPLGKRRQFVEASQGEREKMLMGALVAACELAGERVHVTRGNPTDRE